MTHTSSTFRSAPNSLTSAWGRPVAGLSHSSNCVCVRVLLRVCAACLHCLTGRLCLSTPSVFSLTSRPNASRIFFFFFIFKFVPLAGCSRSLGNVCLVTGIPSEVLGDVTCDVSAEVTRAGRLVEEASRKCAKATDICSSACQSRSPERGA